MKKQLKEKLIDLAKQIVELKSQETPNVSQLKKQALRLFEKLTVLEAAENFMLSSEEESEEEITEVKSEDKSEIPSEEPSLENNIIPENEKSKQEQLPAEDEYDDHAPDGTQYNPGEAITEPNTEKIKDIVAQMPPESLQVDDLFATIHPQENPKNNMEDMGGVHYDHLPQFEPAQRSPEPEKPKSLNDRLKGSIQIGLNDRHAFIKHLFEGSPTDYNRVLSQLNTLKTKSEATSFVIQMVKPDYNNWEGKEEYEARFMDLVAHKFQ